MIYQLLLPPKLIQQKRCSQPLSFPLLDYFPYPELEEDIDSAGAGAGVEPAEKGKKQTMFKQTTDAKLMLTRPKLGRAHVVGYHALTKFIVNRIEVNFLIDTGASCSVVGTRYLNKILPQWKIQLIACSNMTFSGCGSELFPVGVVQSHVILPHHARNVRILP